MPHVRSAVDETLDLLLSAYIAAWWGYRPYFENYTVDASILD